MSCDTVAIELKEGLKPPGKFEGPWTFDQREYVAKALQLVTDLALSLGHLLHLDHSLDPHVLQ